MSGSLTRHSLIKCRTKQCPFTPDEHEEWMELCSRAPEHGHRHDQPSHQHWPKRSQGGKEIVAILCWPMHDRIDNGDWSNDVKDFPGRGPVYFAQDLHGNTLIERPVLSAAAEAVDTPGRDLMRERPARLASAAAPSVGSKEESDGQPDGDIPTPADVGDVAHNRDSSRAPPAASPLTHEAEELTGIERRHTVVANHHCSIARQSTPGHHRKAAHACSSSHWKKIITASPIGPVG